LPSGEFLVLAGLTYARQLLPVLPVARPATGGCAFVGDRHQPGAARSGRAGQRPPAPDDAEEEGGNDTAEREGRLAPDASRREDQLGLVRRLDSFDPDADAANGMASPHPVQLAHPDHDVVICEAGCDGPAGAIVYLQKRQPRQVE
jgi:hypothetical protein